MKITNCSKFVYKMRQMKGMTQKELAEGICTVRHLIRIENGERNPTFYILEKLLTKLGVDISKYLNRFIDDDEQKAYYDTYEIWDCFFENDYKNGESKFLSFKEKSYFNKDDPFIKQFSLLCESIFLRTMYNDPKSALKAATNAIHVTIPKFAPEYIDSHVLTLEEYVIVNNIALCNISMEYNDLGIDILNRLKKSITQKQLPMEIKTRLLPTLCYNLSKYLGLQKSYSESIAVCEEGIEVCKKAKTTRSLGELFYNKAYCLYFLNDMIQAKDFFQRSYNIFILTGNSKMAETIKKNATDKYGILITD